MSIPVGTAVVTTDDAKILLAPTDDPATDILARDVRANMLYERLTGFVVAQLARLDYSRFPLYLVMLPVGLRTVREDDLDVIA